MLKRASLVSEARQVSTQLISSHELSEGIRGILENHADPDKAAPMQAYMKSEMPCRGVTAPIRRKACNDFFRAYRLESKSDWQDAVMDLWNNARFREERYEAIDLSGFRYYDQFQEPDVLPMYEQMVVEGAWWDYVDDLAARRVGLLLERFPAEIRPHMLEWSISDNIWKRRTSIICQIKFKEAADLDLLYACIEPSISEKEFFLRKAIGWALRSLAWTNPAEVVRYVAVNEDRLSGLSRREALKNVPVEMR